MKYYLGTCIDIDYDGENYGFDPTEFAQAEERAIENNIVIEPGVFWKAVKKDLGNAGRDLFEYFDFLRQKEDVWYSQDEGLFVSWAYDVETDMHYIFKGLVY